MIDTPRMPAVHDQVLVEAEFDARMVGFRAVVVNVMPGALWLGLVRPDSQLEMLRPGDPVALTFRRDDVGMVAAATFLSRLGLKQSRLFAIEMPSDLRLIQRRADLRLDTNCPIEYTIVSQSDIGSAGLTGEGKTTNISAGGLQFMVRAPARETVAKGDALELRIQIGSDAVLAEADALRVEDGTDLAPDGRPLPPPRSPRPPRTLIAVQFVAISDGAQDRIIRHIFALQRMRREAPRT
jgi:c-di-GMP-binding flagellar brake protein YcgR